MADVEVEGDYEFERRRFGSNPEELCRLSAWLTEQQVEEVVMESTAQYWQPVWGALERYWKPTRQKREGAERCRERCIWHKPNPIVDARDERKIFPMPSAW